MANPKWITFTEIGKSPSGKTRRWQICGVNGDLLGTVQWFAAWRKYAFRPEAFTVYEQDCLRDIANFCEDATRAHKAP